MQPLRLDVWADVACPWSYIGKRRLDAALATFPHATAVKVTWRSFELDPNAPRTTPPGTAYRAIVARQYEISEAEADTTIARANDVGRASGIPFQLDRVRGGSTFDAHRLIHLATELGVQDDLTEALFRAYFTDGAELGDPRVLANLAVQAGMSERDVRAVLASERYAPEVRVDEDLARQLGVTVIPFYIVNGALAVPGLQTSQVLRTVLEQAWTEAMTAGNG